MMKKGICCAVVAAAMLTVIFSQSAKKTIVFFAAVSESSDTQTVKMTQDLFFSQLTSFPSYTVIDRRTETFVSAEALRERADTADIALYVEIQEQESAWLCTLHACHIPTGISAANTHSYESYYKILFDAKSSLSVLLTDIVSKIAASDTETSARESVAVNTYMPQPLPAVTPELLSGTWEGEEYIDKIIILRGGRGFIIYKNGATMNISVQIAGTGVTVTQTSRPNASFFPELPRDIALENASTAAPIEWKLSAETKDKLSGTKKTLAASAESASPEPAGQPAVVETDIPVVWIRQ